MQQLKSESLDNDELSVGGDFLYYDYCKFFFNTSRMLSFSWEVIVRTLPVSLVARPDKPTTFPGHHGDFDRSLL